MNTRLQNHDYTVSEWKPRPAVREAMQRIAITAVDDSTAVITDTSVSFQNLYERTTISVEPMNVDTVDGMRIAEVITIRTPLTRFKYFDEKDYSVINVFATTGAVVRDTDGDDVIVSRVPLFEGDEKALEDLYTRLIAIAARLHEIGPISGLFHCRGCEEEYAADVVGVPGWDKPSYWGSDEFVCAAERLGERGLFANAGDSRVTVEFPWEQGAVSAIAGDCTSILEIRADHPHPSAGNGLFYHLRLPINFSDEEARECAAKLNRAELQAADLPPFFGAWCTMPRSGIVSFVGFWPNVLYQPGTVTNIAVWTWARSRFARQIIGNME